MQGFLLNIVKCLLLVLIAIFVSLWYVPDVVSGDSLLGALPAKHQLLQKAGDGKIVMVGGSNVSFGLDSKIVSDTFKRPVINMGVHAGLGLEYIVNDVKPYIRPGDVVVLIPEYEQFYTDNFYGEMELVAVLFDVDPAGRKTVDARQWWHLAKYIPTYAARKLKNYIPALLHKRTPLPVDIYHRESFNEYGDAYIHWALPDQDYQPARKNKGDEKVKPEVLTFLSDLRSYVESMGASLLLLPPVIEHESYLNQENMVDSVAADLKKTGIPFAAEPAKYKFAANYFFNSYYHLNRRGVEVRTQLLISDLKPLIKESQK